MTYELTNLDPLTIRGKHAGGEQWWRYENGGWSHCCDHKGPWVSQHMAPPGEVLMPLLARLRAAEWERDEARRDSGSWFGKAHKYREQRDAVVDGVKHANGMLLTLADAPSEGGVNDVRHHLMGTITDEDGKAYRTVLDKYVEDQCAAWGMVEPRLRAFDGIADLTRYHIEQIEAMTKELATARSDLAASKAEVERLNGVVSDYGEQIIEARRLREAEEASRGGPLAYIVWTPKGEHDYLVYGDARDAQDFIDNHNGCVEESEEIGPVIPLYTRDGAKAEVERLRGHVQAIADARKQMCDVNRDEAYTGLRNFFNAAENIAKLALTPAPAAVPAVCECGHGWDEHNAYGDGCIHDYGGKFCQCQKFRPAPAKEVQS
jgi:hypothetical protein